MYISFPGGKLCLFLSSSIITHCEATTMALALFSISATASILPQQQVSTKKGKTKCIESVKKLVNSTGVPSISSSPYHSLQRHNWVKLICGASFEDVVDIRNLSLVYTLAGVDCIDCAADESVINAVNQGIQAALQIVPLRRPWVMISVNDDEDLHFRKAEFDPEDCPLDCSRPCENVCPANAISFGKINLTTQISLGTYTPPVLKEGVITERCYGCGRCFPVCPYDKIRVVTYVRDVAITVELLKRKDVNAIEIHTSGRYIDAFEQLWNGLGDSARLLQLVAVSIPNIGESTVPLMNTMYNIMKPRLHCNNLWQLDGRPMSGDIGRGATRETISFAVRMAAAVKDRPRGFLQLAGGTNAHTVIGLKKEGLFRDNGTDTDSCEDGWINGIAYGGYARKIVGRVLSKMESEHGVVNIEDHPEYLKEALVEALALVGTVKPYHVQV